MKQFISIATFFEPEKPENKGSLNKIQELIQKIEKVSTQGELILIIKDYNQYQNLSINKLSNENVQVKAVSTYKLSKDYIFENVAWQSAIGDILIYHPHCEYLIDYLENIIQYYTSSIDDSILFLVDNYDIANRSKRKFTFKRINQAYLKHSNETIPPETNGYVVNRFAINACFNNQKEQYDPLIALSTSGLSHSKFNPIKYNQNAVRSYKRVEDYGIFDVLDMLTYYTKHEVHKLLSCVIVMILILSTLLSYSFVNTIFISIFCASLGIVTSILIGLYPQFIVARQTFAAANEKNVVGHFEIKHL